MEQERTALLQLKIFFNGRPLRDWGREDHNSDCCQWERVECNPSTGRVIALYLNYTRAGLYYSRPYWYLNTSLFLPFEELKGLYLPKNRIAGCIENEGFDTLSEKLSNLEILDLSYNFFDNSILSSLSEISSLKSLNLGWNNINASNNIDAIDFEKLSRLRKLEFLDIRGNDLQNNTLSYLEFNALSNLEELDISYNMLNQFVATTKANISFNKLKSLDLGGYYYDYEDDYYQYKDSGVQLQQLSLVAFPLLKTLSLSKNNISKTMLNQNLHVLSNLEELFLYNSHLDNNFLQSIGMLASLKSVVLDECGLTGTLPTQGWCDLKNLKNLRLHGNELSGNLPSCLANLTSLRFLDISQNQFTGNIASSPLAHLTLLQYLSISNNHFQVPDSFKSFANHSNLKFFSSDFNHLVSENDLVQTRVSKFQPSVFSLSNCGVEEHLIKPHSFLYYQYDLEFVDLSFNKFGGALPCWLFENNTRLQGFLMKNNSFVGPFHLPSHLSLDVSRIDISNNQIHGQIPSNINLIFPFVEKLLLSGNALEGEIPKWLGGMNSLQILDLSNNQFSGSIPNQLTMGNSLYCLKLSNNNLSGKITATIFNSQSLQYLYLNGNNFKREISQFSSSSFLKVLDISNNHLSGKLPRWIRNLTQLNSLVLSNNSFEGSIPNEFCYNVALQFLDLSKNNLSGSLPSCPNPSYITHLYLSKNRLNGLLTHSFYNISSLVVLDLRENNFIGGIPKWIGNFSKLSILLLKGNHFYGEIPIEVCGIKQLSMIDLSHNQLSGSIPSCLGHLTLTPSTSMSLFSSTYMIMLETFYELQIIPFSTWEVETLIKAEGEEVVMSCFRTQFGFVEDEVEFTTKRFTYTYGSHILQYMSAIDLSCNKLTGLIPSELGNMSEIQSLNLSHNNLTGPIPSTFSNLKQIESLDLSFNNLNAEIPSQLIELNSLEVFSVAHNNLSGTIPYGRAQFGTFDKSSYEGNSLLCGPPLDKSCKETDSQLRPLESLDEEKEYSSINMHMFYISFVVSYVIVLLSIIVVLYINPYWRRAWFYLAERCVTKLLLYCGQVFEILVLYFLSV
ncbi:hypothetical protein SLEP1_g29920 [Rubroshorea leprosula]|uniref:Leucine-rich repeat-containing N-terminal plant-type domain-containing protein n=1 Tax=Rubroshorea leprosula TaxID=152421 RepID=A0AAV5K4K6_9ROSI|nr:hypothetical protein SLEP1_g29920 [Rubroshorea leprosula]